MSKRQKILETRNREETTATPPENDALLKKISQADGDPEALQMGELSGASAAEMIITEPSVRAREISAQKSVTLGLGPASHTGRT